ncbi:hypothetical protein D3C72_2389110 [compost metagenome]
MTSNLRSADRSITTAFVRQAQYSSMAPSLANSCGSQKPLYSMKLRVCLAKLWWKPVSRVILGSASGVVRRAIARWNLFCPE